MCTFREGGRIGVAISRRDSIKRVTVSAVEFFLVDVVLSTLLHFSRVLNLLPTRMQQDNNAEVLNRVKRKIRLKMELVFDTYLTPESDFPTCDSPVWLFGRSYSTHYDIEELRRCVATCMWITYRKNFPSVGDTSLTSDRGWGCMIRAGQMLLAKTLLLRHLGSDWHWEADCRDPVYLQILSLFTDIRSAPLSLHQIAQSGASLGKPVGSWLGPNTVAQALKKLIACDSSSVDLQIHIAMDSTIVKSEVKRACLSPLNVGFHQSESVPSAYSIITPRVDPRWKPLLLVIPLRLGLSDLNPSYIPGIKAAFEIPQSVGIIGGRPNHALYFIGYAENEVLFLDPHTVQPSVTVASKKYATEKLADETYHIHKPGRMAFSSMDPSIAVCFYCKSEADFDAVCAKLNERFLLTPLALFEMCDRRPNDWSSMPLSSSKISSSLGFTSVGSCGTLLSNKSSSSSVHSLGSSSSTSSPGKNKSEADDEEFEILG